MSKPEKDPSYFEEPHLKNGGFSTDPSEAKADEVLEKTRHDEATPEQRVEHTVWDEPGLSQELIHDITAPGLTYSEWLLKRRVNTSTAKSWLITWAIVLAAGPWAILGTFIYGFSSLETSLPYAMAIVVFGTVTEEMMKIALALYVVEKRPFLFKSPLQIVVCALAGGLVFSAVENLLYIYIYIDEPSGSLIMWRWSVCVFLHTGCSLVASLGLLKIWRQVWKNLKRPPLSLAFPYLILAVVIHGAYNTLALVLSLVDFHF